MTTPHSRRERKAAKLIMSGEVRPYRTTLTGCNCPDATYRPGVVCKHRRALMVSADLKARCAQQATTPAKATLSLEERKARAEAAILVLRGDENDSLV